MSRCSLLKTITFTMTITKQQPPLLQQQKTTKPQPPLLQQQNNSLHYYNNKTTTSTITYIKKIWELEDPSKPPNGKITMHSFRPCVIAKGIFLDIFFHSVFWSVDNIYVKSSSQLGLNGKIFLNCKTIEFCRQSTARHK
jgi:hypothetical protein